MGVYPAESGFLPFLSLPWGVVLAGDGLKALLRWQNPFVPISGGYRP